MRRAPGPLLLCLLAGAAGCVGLGAPGDRCERDADCSGECTNTGECVSAGSSLSVEIRWTLDGAAPTPSDPAPCDEVGELGVAFFAGGEPGPSYRPVTCDLGQITFDKMPPYLDAVVLTAFGPRGRELDRASASLEPAGETRVTFELQL